MPAAGWLRKVTGSQRPGLAHRTRPRLRSTAELRLDFFGRSGVQQGPGESLRAAWEEHAIEGLLAATARNLPDEERRELAARVARVKECIERGEIDLAFEAIERLRDVPCVPPGDDDEPPNHGWRWRLQVGLEFVATSTAAWTLRYPNLAIWPGSRGRRGTQINMGFVCGSGAHSTDYTVIKKVASGGSRGEIYQAWEDAIKEWKEKKDPEEVQRLGRGWMGEAGWEAKYPHIADWIGRGKRHCFRIDIDFVDCTSSIKAWFYDKPSNTETVLIERQMDTVSEDEVLSVLDATIGAWLGVRGEPG